MIDERALTKEKIAQLPATKGNDFAMFGYNDVVSAVKMLIQNQVNPLAKLAHIIGELSWNNKEKGEEAMKEINTLINNPYECFPAFKKGDKE